MKSRIKKKNAKELFWRWAIILTLAAAMVLVALMGYQSRQYLIYSENLDKVAVTVDTQELTLEDLAFYVLYEEHSVEEKARVYDEENSMNFWNIHTNQVFIKTEAQKTAMNMAVHDYLFYNEALKCGLALDEEEKSLLEDRRTDYWED